MAADILIESTIAASAAAFSAVTSEQRLASALSANFSTISGVAGAITARSTIRDDEATP
jgi:hypothetical protein